MNMLEGIYFPAKKININESCKNITNNDVVDDSFRQRRENFRKRVKL